MRSRTLVILAVLILSTPAAFAAGWGSRGEIEPSTDFDRDRLRMWQEANVEADRKVYFNAYAGWYAGYVAGASTPINLNVAALGTAHQSYPYRSVAILGVWRDCNDDGYMGYGEQGIVEYPSQLLTVPNANGRIVGTSICPLDPLPDLITGDWMPSHNDGKVVRELIPIGWNYQPNGYSLPGTTDNKGCNTRTSAVTCTEPNPFNINDTAARVWGDWGAPGERAGTQCYVRPHPQGTFHSIGQFREYADCFATNKINNTIDQSGQRARYEEIKGNDCDNSGTGTAYHPGCNPWGEPQQPALVDVADCKSDDQAFQSPRYIDIDGDGKQTPTRPLEPVPGQPSHAWEPNLTRVNVSHPRAPPGINTQGTIAGTLNETFADTDNCRENQDADGGFSWLPYATEAPISNQNGVRFQHDQVLTYVEGNRHAGPPVGAVQRLALGYSYSQNLGLGLTSFEGLWLGTSVTAASRNPYLNRDALTPMPVTYTSFYAYVSPAAAEKFALVFPTATAASYGSEACTDGTGKGIKQTNGWECDPDLWWTGEDPTCTPGTTGCQRADVADGRMEYFVRVGHPYQLRDVDCWDESTDELRREGIHFGLLTGSICI